MIKFYRTKVNTEMCKCNNRKYYGNNSDYQLIFQANFKSSWILNHEGIFTRKPIEM